MDFMKMRGQVAIVTGAGRGVGRACALRLAEAGADVVLTDIQADAIEGVRGDIKALGRRAVAMRGDVSVKDDVDAVVAKTLSEFGRVDVLVNNAGICPVVKYYDVTEATWEKILDINLKGMFFYCQAVAPLLTEQKGGAIINVASMGIWTGGGRSLCSLCGFEGGCGRRDAPFRALSGAVWHQGERCSAGHYRYGYDFRMD